MKKDSPILNKSLEFAVRIVKLSTFLQEKIGYTFSPITQQILKSGTSIGANVREAEYAESSEDFIHKLKIALKEAYETEFWLEVLHQGGQLNESGFESLTLDCKELLKLLISIINKTKKNTSDKQ